MNRITRIIAAYIPSDKDLDILEKRHPHVEVRKLYYDFLRTPPSIREKEWGTDDFTFLVNLIGRVEPIKIVEEFGERITRKLMKYYK